MDAHLPFDERFVAQHESFLRRLARGLVGRDPDAVDDAVQDAWLRALEAPPRAEPRAYLAALVRNAFARCGAREAARPAVERRAAREERVGGDASVRATSDGDIVRRLELSEELARALRGLPEAQRRALFLRYSEDLSPKAIAARTGEPVGTVKTRLARGLAALRSELDARHGGARSAWGGAALSWALDARESATARASLGARAATITWLVGAAALLAVASLALRPRASRAPAALPAVVGTVTATAAAPTATAMPQPRAAAASSAIAVRMPDGGTQTPFVPGEARVALRLVDEAGAPLVGASVDATWRAAGEAVLADWGAPPPSAPAHTATSVTGDAELALPAHPDAGWRLSARAPGHAEWVAEIGVLAPGQRVELGVKSLGPGARLEVTVLDETGAPFAANGPLYVWVAPTPETIGKQTLAPPRGRVAEAQGSVTLVESLPCGYARVRLAKYGLEAPLVPLPAGATGQVTLRFAEPVAELPFRALVERVQGKVPTEVSLSLTGPTGAAVPPDEIQGGRSALWRHLPPAAHVLRVSAPGFLPLERSVSPDVDEFVSLVPDSGVRLRFVDANGEPVSSRAHLARYAGNGSWPTDLGLPVSEAPEVALVSGDHRLKVRGERFAARDVEVLGLAMGEWRDLEVEVTPLSVIAGEVVDARSTPLPGALIQVLAPAEQDDGPASFVGTPGGPVGPDRRAELGYCRADATGRFALAVDSAGPVVLRAAACRRPASFDAHHAPAFAERQAATALLGATELTFPGVEEANGVSLAVADLTRVSGRLVGEAHAPFDDVVVYLRRELPAVALELYEQLLCESVTLEPVELDGRFVFKEVAPGRYTLLLRTTWDPIEPSSIGRDALELTELDVPVVGLSDVVVDLTAALPPPLEVVVRSNEALASTLVGASRRSSDSFGEAFARLSRTEEPGAAHVARGRLRVGPGSRRTVCVNEPTDGWSLQREVDTSIAPGPVVFDVQVARTTVTFVRASGAPVAGSTVHLESTTPGAPPPPYVLTRVLATTDEHGRATMRLPVGDVVLSVGGPRGLGARVPAFAWPPAQGTALVVPD